MENNTGQLVLIRTCDVRYSAEVQHWRYFNMMTELLPVAVIPVIVESYYLIGNNIFVTYYGHLLVITELKISKNKDSLGVLLNNFVNKPSFKNLYVLFLRMVHRCKKCSDV